MPSVSHAAFGSCTSAFPNATNKTVGFLWCIQLEIDRNLITHTHRFAFLHARLPFRHAFDDADGFFIAAATNASKHFHFTDAAVFLNNKTDKHTTRDVFVFGLFWIFDVVGHIIHQGFFTAREFGHLFNDLIDSVFFGCGYVKQLFKKMFGKGECKRFNAVC